MDGCIDRQQTDRRIEGRMDGWVDRDTDRQTERLADGYIDRETEDNQRDISR